ncbi:MAG: hypothetical protein COV45_01175 [Deltaproteobacteria bacterium CG11_big_fil_rev_8_21_14_0_20_47_16]|nr:MAG: hypothetical protein COV45_01175 [Deltaproteobacteria bacterium CG11_big_fil_rev_8_21_14_0_20_47_16]
MRIVALLSILIARTAWACPICNQDGSISRNFILIVMGAGILGMASLLLWSIGRGQYEDVEEVKYRILELYRRTSVRIH